MELLLEDFLDSAPFHASDTKITNQLLGNLALVSLRQTRLGYTRRQRKQLRRLDLAAARTRVRGPYLWFRCISRSLSQQTAKLVVDYNAHALPLSRADTADEEDVRRYVEWLSRRLGVPVERLDLPEPFLRRWQSLGHRPSGVPAARQDLEVHGFQGSDFTAIHFLSADPQPVAEIRRLYGEQVAALVGRDRRDNIRRVLRTYPLHRWPKEQRTLNPLLLHAHYVAGGRILLLPLRLLWWGLVLEVRAVLLLGRIVREVLHPAASELEALAEPDPYAVAVRKIHRMRRPIFLECLRMRAQFDPEYLGAAIPGEQPETALAAAAPIEEDLALIDAEPALRQQFRRLAAQRRRQVVDFRRLLAELGGEEWPGESLRAATIAYTIDYRGVRSRWEGRGRIPILAPQKWDGPPPASAQDDALAYPREVLRAVARDPATWTRQLVVLRAVQTLSVLDLKTYCDLAAELGEYEVSE